MKVKYREGDVFVIPVGNRFAICQIVFAPKGKFKKVIGFCALFIQDDKIFKNDDILNPIAIMDMGRETKVIFTGNKNIENGSWNIVDNVDLTEEKKKLRIFNYAGGLYDGEEEIRRIPVSEYSNFTTMEVFGFELVQKILTSI